MPGSCSDFMVMTYLVQQTRINMETEKESSTEIHSRKPGLSGKLVMLCQWVSGDKWGSRFSKG